MNPYHDGSNEYADYRRGYAAGVGAIAGGMRFPKVIPRGWTTAFRVGYADAFAKDR